MLGRGAGERGRGRTRGWGWSTSVGTRGKREGRTARQIFPSFVSGPGGVLISKVGGTKEERSGRETSRKGEFEEMEKMKTLVEVAHAAAIQLRSRAEYAYAQPVFYLCGPSQLFTFFQRATFDKGTTYTDLLARLNYL